MNTSLLEAGVILMAHNLVGQQFSGSNPIPQGSRYPSFGEAGGSFSPYGAFRTADGWMMIGVSNNRIFRRLCTALEHAEWAEDARFATNMARVEHRAEMDAALQKLLLEKPTAYWKAHFDTHDVPVSAIQDAAQVLSDPQVAAVHQLESVTLPGQNGRTVKVPRVPLHLSMTPIEQLGLAPSFGEQGREILMESGYTETEIAELVEERVCKLS